MSGSKTFVMYAPSDDGRLYYNTSVTPQGQMSLDLDAGTWERAAGPAVRDQFDFSPVDVLRPDLGGGGGGGSGGGGGGGGGQHPAFADATPTVCEVGPGDVLYVPSYWWHEVLSRPDPQDGWNLAVNWWYRAVRPLPEGRIKLNGGQDVSGNWPT